MNKPAQILLDIDSLLAGEWAQCQQLLSSSYPLPLDENRRILAREQLIDLLKQQAVNINTPLTDAMQSQLEPTESLGQELFSALRFADHLFDNYIKNSKIHPHIKTVLKQFRTGAALCLLNEKLPWRDTSPTSSSFALIYQNTIGWQPELGRAAERFAQTLEPLIKQLATAYSQNKQAIATEELTAFFSREQQRLKKVEKRLKDTEVGVLHAKHAQQLSAKTLNEQMTGKKLPANISAFLQGPWRESMRLLIIHSGKESEQWQRMLRLTETLIWSLQPIENDAARQHVYHSISELSDELQEVTIGLHHSSKLDDELAAIEQQHLKVLKSEELDYDSFELIDSSDPLINTQASISSHLLTRASAFNEGQWFIHYSDAGEKRIKLSVKINPAQQLLFTNFLGIKTDQYNLEEFSYLLSSQVIIPIKLIDPFMITGEKVLRTLLEHHQHQQTKAANEKVIEEEIARKKKLAQEEEKINALKEAEEFAKKQQQARLLAEKKSKQLRQQQAQEKRTQGISEKLHHLHIGGRVMFHSSDGEDAICRLAVILQSSGDYIFVDHSGVKQHCLNKQQLANKLMEKSAEIIDQGSSFESSLEQVVNGLRKKN